jgi:hypothetical protein
MSKKKNSYALKAQRKTLTGTDSETSASKGNFKRTAAETGKDLLIGVIGGGLAGALVGRPSLLVGLAVTGVGHFMGSPAVAVFGAGMMASGGYQVVAGAMNGADEKTKLEKAKERLTNFKEVIKHQFYLDKIVKSKKKKESESTDGIGEVKYYTYPEKNEELGESKTPEMKELERIEAQMETSAQKFAEKNSMSGTEMQERLL